MDKTRMLRMFLRVAEAGSITAVANVLDCSVSYVSRVVSELEDDLHVRLFDRTTRGIRLTGVGERYYERCAQIIADLDRADADAADAASMKQPAGMLRIHAMPGLGRRHLAACIVAYQRRYPNVDVSLTLSSVMPRLVEEQFDVSVVTAQTLPESDYVSEVTTVGRSILVTAPSYLDMRRSLSVDELVGHACVELELPSSLDESWLLQCVDGEVMQDEMNVRLKVNDPDALRAAVIAGGGIGALPLYCAIDDLRTGRLVRVSAQFRLWPFNVYSVYPSRRYVDAKIHTFVEFIKHELGVRFAEEEAELHPWCERVENSLRGGEFTSADSASHEQACELC
ncbi:LysR family transcriptional regulator [Paraburkholderia sp. JHI869]|uniref:LysR family transcriptional regulator n=1 Tax=Paraburkholderia sp. JHI869 TaxID=3112959 RepID=UPI00317E9022